MGYGLLILAKMHQGRIIVNTVQEESACLVVRCNALQESQSIADTIRGGSRELGWVEKSVNGYDLLK